MLKSIIKEAANVRKELFIPAVICSAITIFGSSIIDYFTFSLQLPVNTIFVTNVLGGIFTGICVYISIVYTHIKASSANGMIRS